MYVTVDQRWETIMGRGYDKLGTRGGICKPLKYQCTKEEVSIVCRFHSAWGKSTVSHCLVKWRWCTSSIMSHTLLLGRSKFEIVKVSKRVKSTLWFWDLKYFGTLVVCRYRLLWYLVCYPICTLLSAIFD